MAYMFVIGRCILCGWVIHFNADRVPSIRVRWEHGQPVFDNKNGEREPLCRHCCEAFNESLVSHGLEPCPIPADAWEPELVQ